MKARNNGVNGTLKLVFRAHPLLFSLEGFSYLGGAAVGGLMPVAWALLFGAAESADSAELAKAMAVFALFCAAETLFRLVGRLSTRWFCFNERLLRSLRLKLYEHSSRLSAESFDKSETYNALLRADKAIAGNEPMNIMNAFFQTPALAISLAITSATLTVYSPLLLLAALVSLAPATAVQLIKGKERYALSRAQSPERRAKSYFYSLFGSLPSAREMRVFGSGKLFEEKWAAAAASLCTGERKLFRRRLRRELPAEFVKTAGYGLGIVLSAALLGAGQITLSSFGAALAAFASVQTCYTSLLRDLTSFRESRMFFADYTEFMSEPSEAPAAANGEISLENACYTYPGASGPALSDISLKLGQGEHVALVGENGSGKTTLGMLLCGLYRPTSGSASPASATAAVLQDYVRWLYTPRHNVGFGDVAKLHDDAALLAAMRAAGCENTELETALGRELGGTELSGGEWQRLAVARGYMAGENAGFALFDEPTAAIDPIAERSVIASFLDMTAGKTSVFITHRIGAARLADRIVVLKNGRIAEIGTHEALLEAGGEYARLWSAQSKLYDN